MAKKLAGKTAGRPGRGATRSVKPAARSRQGKVKPGKRPAALSLELTPAARPARRGARGFVGRKATAPVVRRDEAPARKAAPKGKAKPAGRGSVSQRTDATAPPMRKLRMQSSPDAVNRDTTNRHAFKERDFEAFFQAEIEAELASEAEIHNDRIARWRCQCCDAVIPVPRRTTVFHGEFVLEHDDVDGLLVNGAKFVPRTDTPLQLVQPGRLRNPFTGKKLSDEGYAPVDLS